MKKLLVVILMFMMVFGSVACQATEDAPVVEEPVAEEPVVEEPVEEPLKVAALLSGPINDMGWNASAYEGLLMLEDSYGCEISYLENVAQSDMEENFRNYALQGYDVIFGHGFQFGDAATKVAAEFPDTDFIIISSDISNGTNLGSANTKNEDQGFIAGALAAMISETGMVAGLGGMDIPPIRSSVVGFAAGAKYINPDIEVKTVLTGSNDDVGKAKETALALIDDGVDVIFANANQAGLGSIEACQDRGVWSIGSNQDQNPSAPETVVQSIIKSTPQLFNYVVGLIVDGTYEAKFHGLGVKEGAIFLSDWHGFDETFPEAVAELDEVIQGLADGSIQYDPSEYDF